MNCLIAGDSMIASIKELETELAELKASIPQVKHDAIVEAMTATAQQFEANSMYVVDACDEDDLLKYATNILTQAKEQGQ